MSKQAPFSVHVIGAQVWDPNQDNLDVEVWFPDGRRFGATFFTLQNVQRLFEKNRATGECGAGLYLWASNMILVRELSMAAIESTVKDLMDKGEFEQAFAAL
jgi:hypothetical protein